MMDRTNRDGGASLVEFALLLPMLLLIVLGIIEFGLLFAQYNEIRHGAREGARYAAVSNPDLDGVAGVGDDADVVKAVCDSINLPGATIEVSMTATANPPKRLDYGTLTVDADVSGLSGVPIISNFLPSNLSNSATFRLEQDAGWAPFGLTPCP